MRSVEPIQYLRGGRALVLVLKGVAADPKKSRARWLHAGADCGFRDAERDVC